MQRYGNSSGNSGVVAYQIGDDWIKVAFKARGLYLYTYASTGAERIERMKALALSGRGLSTYIATQVRDAYAKQLR